MATFPVITKEAARLSELLEYRVLDTPPEPQFDELTALAAAICETPVAAINFLDAERYWTKSCTGFEPSEGPSELSFCFHAVLSGETLSVADTRVDERFASHPAVTGDPSIRFYTGVPLVTAAGHALGALCVADMRPRELSAVQLAGLKTLARQVIAQLELRRAHVRLKNVYEELRAYSGIVAAQKERLIESARLAALGEMASGVAHELNNPLMIVSGNLFLLEKYLSASPAWDGEKLRKFAGAMQRACVRMTEVVKGLNVFARDASNDPLVYVDISGIVSQTLALCSAHLKASNIVLTVDCPAALTVLARPAQISTILLNLLTNAREAVQFAAHREIAVVAEARDEMIELRVSDSGRGIAPEHQGKIMQPFFTTKGVGEGTGLGLSIAYGLAAANDAVLMFDPARERTTFVLRLRKPGRQEAA